MIENADEYCVDTETHDEGYPEIELTGTSIAWNEKEGAYIPTGHEKGAQLPEGLVIEKLHQAMTNSKAKWVVMHNAKYDIKVLDLVMRKYDLIDKPTIGIWEENQIFDTMLASWMLNTETPNGLKYLSGEFLNEDQVELIDFCPWVKHPKGNSTREKLYLTEKTDIDEMGLYAIDDVTFPLRLKNHHFMEELKKEGFEKAMWDMEIPLMFILAEAEKAGVKLNKERLERWKDDAPKMIEKIRQEIYDLRPVSDGAHVTVNGTRKKFNPNSTQQLNVVLFDEIGIQPMGKPLKTGDYSCNGDYLETWANNYEIAQKILEFKQVKKLKSTYLDGLNRRLSPDGRIRTNFNQIISTGRLSSARPNLQNIPRPENDVFGLRELFMAEEGKSLVVADFSQVEYRVLAHLSKDPEFIKAYNNGEDLHGYAAKLLYDLECTSHEVKKLHKDLRSTAKVFNFGTIYEAGPETLASGTGVSVEKAAELKQKYLDRFKGIDKFIDYQHYKAERDGFVTTITGRKRHLEPATVDPDKIRDKKKAKRAWAKKYAYLRKATNTPVQGSAADIMALAMREVQKELLKRGLFPETRMILQVHDEVMVETPTEHVEEVRQILHDNMTDVVKLRVPITVDIDSGQLWSEAK
jgi:DNA polymerase-1